jgi:antitoxin component YwqK of YwqJK toxin-antitoxin module
MTPFQNQKIFRWFRLAVMVVSAVFIFRWIVIETIFTRRTYYPNGRIATKARTDLPFYETSLQGPAEAWDQDGHLIYQMNYGSHPVGTALDGLQRWYGPDGKILDQWIYHDGFPADGERIAHWPNGIIRSITNYKKGNFDGRVAEWAENGQVLTDWTYHNGQPEDGTVITHFANGMMESIIKFKNGLKDGMSKNWNDKGVLLREENWKAGKKSGRQSNFAARIISNITLGEGYTTIEYWGNGRKKFEAQYDPEGRLNGASKDYFLDGRLKDTGNSVHGKAIEGSYREWNDQGVLVMKR